MLKSAWLKWLCLFGLPIIFCWRIFKHPSFLGIADWDYHFYINEVVMKSLLVYHQLPLWDPWRCGGIPLLQHYETPLLSPLYLLSLVMSTPVAMKVNILIHYFIGLWGMYLVGKKIYKIENLIFILLGASVFVFNGFISLQITAGHMWILPSAFIPFIFLYFERGTRDKSVRDLILSAGFFALMVFDSGFYPGSFLALFLVIYSVLMAVVVKEWRYIPNLFMVGFYSALFSAIKLVPAFDYFLEYPRARDDPEVLPAQFLGDIFLNRHQSVSTFLSDAQRYQWYEYGCYLGLALGVLVLAGLFKGFFRHQKRQLVLGMCFLFFFLLLLGNFSDFSLYTLLRMLPVYSSQHVTGRFLIFLTFTAGLLIFGLASKLEIFERNRKSASLTAGICVLILADLVFVNSKTFGDAFVVSEDKVLAMYDVARDSSQPIMRESESYMFNIQDRRGPDIKFLPVFSTHYIAQKLNRVVTQCYEATHPDLGFNPNQPLVFSSDPEAKIGGIELSPNRISFSLDASRQTEVILNQNYIRGWRISSFDVYPKKHQIAALILPGHYEKITFYYFPTSVLIGLFISVVAFGISVVHLRRGRGR